MAAAPEAEYHSKDFEWEDLRRAVESDPSFRYHFSSPSPPPPPRPSGEGHAGSWKGFHRRHSTGRFFKERRYLLKEFPELLACVGPAKVLEVGCGSGSTVLPILRAKMSIEVYACDCSQEALDNAREVLSSAEGALAELHFHPFLHDIAKAPFPSWLLCVSCRNSVIEDQAGVSSAFEAKLTVNHPELLKTACCIGGFDFITMIFTLSAVPLENMAFVVAECYSVLKPGSLLLFRDYGLYDMTMLRFPVEQKIGDKQYMRSDGTLSYFFSLDLVRGVFTDAGFLELELEYCCISSKNRRTNKTMRRVWVHGKFQKP